MFITIQLNIHVVVYHLSPPLEDYAGRESRLTIFFSYIANTYYRTWIHMVFILIILVSGFEAY